MLHKSKQINLLDFDELRRIISESVFQSMREFPHHGRVSCYDHSLMVAGRALRSAYRRNLDFLSAAKGGLLHDLYLYHKRSVRRSIHTLRHPETALHNAERNFDLNDIVRCSIVNHMWPLTPVKPVFPESIIVANADKASAIGDYRRSAGMKLKKLYTKRLFFLR